MSEQATNGRVPVETDAVSRTTTGADDRQQAAAEAKMAEFHKAKHENHFEEVHQTRTYGGREFDLLFHRQPTSAGFRTDYYAPLCQETTVEDGIRCDRDVAVPISGGRTVYIDVYRPEGKLENLPVILMWTPYGKRHWYGAAETPGLHQAMGVPRGTISKRAAFEGADASFWCNQGYCVVNADAPGTGNSTGDNNFMFCAEGGQDGKEVIDWIGEQQWCNGRVGMAGNSGLAMSQWVIAAARPEHLACIAPWEGTSDLYRENVCVGGIPAPAFAELIWWDFRDPGLQPDPSYMIHEDDTFNEYWANHAVELENIRIPVYVCAGYSHFHLRGSMEGFRRIKSRNKWLRMHRDFEWPDFNQPENQADLKLFFDRYLKNIHNGWEMTPRVRMDVMDAYDLDFRSRRPESDFPLPRTQFTKYYLDAATRSLSLEPVSAESSVTYDSLAGQVDFDLEVTEDLELSGNFVVRVWVSSETTDADVFVLVQKADERGELLPTTVFGVADPGAKGQLRASMRALDTEKSLPHLPKYTFTRHEPLTPGEPVALDIEVWPHARIWHAGERLRVCIAGRPLRDPSWFLPTNVESVNEGAHTIHTGGRYESYLLAPVIPPKHKSGAFEVR